MSWEQRNADFCNAQTDAQMAYIEAEREVDRLQTENARLRELVRKYVEYTSQDRCEGCVCKRKCNDGDVDECWQRPEIRELARELGIEVES